METTKYRKTKCTSAKYCLIILMPYRPKHSTTITKLYLYLLMYDKTTQHYVLYNKGSQPSLRISYYSCMI